MDRHNRHVVCSKTNGRAYRQLANGPAGITHYFQSICPMRGDAMLNSFVCDVLCCAEVFRSRFPSNPPAVSPDSKIPFLPCPAHPFQRSPPSTRHKCSPPPHFPTFSPSSNPHFSRLRHRLRRRHHSSLHLHFLLPTFHPHARQHRFFFVSCNPKEEDQPCRQVVRGLQAEHQLIDPMTNPLTD